VVDASEKSMTNDLDLEAIVRVAGTKTSQTVIVVNQNTSMISGRKVALDQGSQSEFAKGVSEKKEKKVSSKWFEDLKDSIQDTLKENVYKIALKAAVVAAIATTGMMMNAGAPVIQANSAPKRATVAITPTVRHSESIDVSDVPMTPTARAIKSAMDPSVRPEDNFFLHALGTWRKSASTRIREDQQYVDYSTEITDDLDKTLEDIYRSKSPQTPEGRQIVQMHRLLREGLRGRGLEPIRPLLDRVLKADSRSELSMALGEMHRYGLKVGWRIYFLPYDYDAKTMAIHMDHSRLSLDHAGRYFATNATERMNGVAKLMAATFVQLGTPHDDADRAAKVLLEMEMRMANFDRRYLDNPGATPPKASTPKALADRYPDIDFQAYLKGLQAKRNTSSAPIVIHVPDTMAVISSLFGEAHRKHLKLWLAWQIIKDMAVYLDDSIYAGHFNFFEAEVKGVKARPDSTVFANGMTRKLLAYPLVREYARLKVDHRTIAKAKELAENMRRTLISQLSGSSLMGSESKKEAIAKIQKLIISVGIPERYPDIRRVHLRDDLPLAVNVLALKKRSTSWYVDQLGQPVDRKRWPEIMNPLQAGAVADRWRNFIGIGLPMLTSPSFSANGDPAANYGNLGCVIGHELGHLFDTWGRFYDSNGNHREWMSHEDAAKFDAQYQKLKSHISTYEVLPGVTADPARTINEAAADAFGVQIAFLSAQRVCDLQSASVEYHGLTRAQVFFYSYAFSYRGLESEEFLRDFVATDPHSPLEYCVNGPLANFKGFASAFGISTIGKMNVGEANRVKLW